MSGKECPFTAVKNVELFTLVTSGLLAGRSLGLLAYTNPLLSGVKDGENQKECLNALRKKTGWD